MLNNNDSQVKNISIIKDEITLLSFLVLFIGIVSTDSYYSVFGLKYQFLNLPFFHIIYRGLTIIVDAPYMCVIYLLAFGILTIDLSSSKKMFQKVIILKQLDSTKFISYLIIGLLIILVYPLSIHAGYKQAMADSFTTTTKLNRISNITFDDNSIITEEKGYVLLMENSDYLYLFKLLDEKQGQNYENTEPIIKRYSKSEIRSYETFK